MIKFGNQVKAVLRIKPRSFALLLIKVKVRPDTVWPRFYLLYYAHSIFAHINELIKPREWLETSPAGLFEILMEVLFVLRTLWCNF